MLADASIDFCQHGATGMHGEEIFEKCPRAKVLRTEGLKLWCILGLHDAVVYTNRECSSRAVADLTYSVVLG